MRLISMLTHNDQTVDKAMGHYIEGRDAITKEWGFKDTNISLKDAIALAEAMHRDGKNVYFESLKTTSQEGLESAKIALQCKADYIIGMEYFENVHELLKDKELKYLPTCGRRAGYPQRMLYGAIDEIIDDAKRILSKGVDGISLSVFRYKDGDPLELAKKFVKQIDAPICLTGSINSNDRLDFLKEVQPWGFAVGSALFEPEIFPGDTIAQKLDYINNYLKVKNC